MAPQAGGQSMDDGKDTPRHLLVRMSYTHAGDFRNALIRRLSVLQGYQGKCIAIGHEAYAVRNSLRRWDEHFSMALLEFPSETLLERWYTSDPDVKQKDWLEGIDMVSLPVSTPIDALTGAEEDPWFCIAETHAQSPYVSMETLVAMATEATEGMGEVVRVTETESSTHHRGLYNPGRLIINYCNATEHSPGVPECSVNALPEADVFLFKLQPLCLPLTYLSNPAAMEI